MRDFFRNRAQAINKKQFSSKWFLALFVGTVIYYLTIKLGFNYAMAPNSASPVWPAAGVGVILILTLGYWAGPAILIGAFVAHYQADHAFAFPLWASLSNWLEAFVAVRFFLFLQPVGEKIGEYGNHVLLFLVAAVSAIVGASVGVTGLYLFHFVSAEGIINAWLTWWSGDAIGILALAPLASVRIAFPKSKIEFLEKAFSTFCILAAIALTTYMVFSDQRWAPYLMVIFPFLLLSAALLPKISMYIAATLIGAVGVWKTCEGLGPFSGGTTNENLLHLQVFLAAVFFTTHVLVVLRQERSLRIPGIALMFCWCLTATAYFSSYTSGAEKERENFKVTARQMTESLKDRLEDYTRVLESGASLFYSSENVREEEFNTFAQKLRLRERYPGISAIGFISYVRSKDAKTFENDNFPIQEFKQGAKKSGDHLVLKYLYVPNPKTIGLDLTTEPKRLEAALRARDSGQAVLTEPIILKTYGKIGFLLMKPLYAVKEDIDDIQLRRKHFLGLIHSPILAEDFINSILLRPEANPLSMTAYALTNEGKVSLYNSADKGKPQSEAITYADFAGVPFEFHWRRASSYIGTSNYMATWVAFFGILISACIAVLISTLENLTSRAQSIADATNMELREREKKWRTLMDIAPVGIYLTTPEGRTVYSNRCLAKMIGVTAESLVDFNWFNFIHPDDQKMISDRWDDFIKNKTPYLIDYRFAKNTSDGLEVTFVRAEATALIDDDGNVTGYLGVIQDITQLQEQQIAMVTASRMSSLGEMAAGIAHEINNPLTIISGNMQLLKNALDKNSATDPLMARYAANAESTVNRIVQIIKGL
ncbi:MAG: CHASE domain-containing protein, partial [Bdellovibrionota bacterium]